MATGTTDSSPFVVSAGSNLGDRQYFLRRAVFELSRVSRVVRVSSLFESAAVDSRPGTPAYLNLVLAGLFHGGARLLLDRLMEIERRLGRRRPWPNAPRTIDLDLILFDGMHVREAALTLPHPRYRRREFVLAPLRELALGWCDRGQPVAGERSAGEAHSP